MAEKKNAEESKAAPSVQILNTYIKDLSFENIGLQNNYIAKSQPKFELNLNINNKQLEGADNLFEISMNIKVKSTEDKQTIFLLDLDHAGRFLLRDVPEDQRVPYLYIECPRLLFPYTRRVVSTITMDGGLLPLNLDHVDFVQMFQNSVKQAQENAGKKPS